MHQDERVTTYLLGPGTADAAGILIAAGAEVVSTQTGPEWVARTAAHLAAELSAARVRPPFIVAVGGGAAADLPALALSLRTLRRAAHGYVLVEPDLRIEGRAADWPDAPVTVVTLDAGVERSATLRGWRIVEGRWPEDALRVLDLD